MNLNSVQDILVCVDFTAKWCGPCKKIAPILDEMAKEFDGKVQFLKVCIACRVFLLFNITKSSFLVGPYL